MSLRLRELRESRSVKQTDVAQAIDVPITTYRKYETGERKAPTDVLLALADYYDTSLDYLMGRDVSPAEAQRSQLIALYDMLNSEGKDLLVVIAKVIVKSGDYLSI